MDARIVDATTTTAVSPTKDQVARGEPKHKRQREFARRAEIMLHVRRLHKPGVTLPEIVNMYGRL
jgi:hypothetical protein